MQFIQLLVKTDTEGGLLRKAKGFFHRNFTGSWTEKYLIAELLISRYLDNWSLIASRCHWKWHSYPRNNNCIIHCYAETHSSKVLHPASYHFSKSNLQQNFFQIVISSFLDTYYSKAGSRVQLSLLTSCQRPNLFLSFIQKAHTEEHYWLSQTVSSLIKFAIPNTWLWSTALISTLLSVQAASSLLIQQLTPLQLQVVSKQTFPEPAPQLEPVNQ